MKTEKRYQVFVSSTFEDLQEERKEVMQALLELDCIPAGMELFQASNDDQWTLIKRVIDDCDYYLVILGGRYGSTRDDGMSFTEMEYRYAVDSEKPIMGFVHKDPGKLESRRTEQDPEKKKRLTAFRDLVQQKMCRQWETAQELGSVVSRSLVRTIKETPAIGWVRGDQMYSDAAATEILRLKKDNEVLKTELDNLRVGPPKGIEDLAQGNDSIEIEFRWSRGGFGESEIKQTWRTTWEGVFLVVAPMMIKEANEHAMFRTIRDKCMREMDIKVHEYQFKIDDDVLRSILVQFRALGLAQLSAKVKPPSDTSTYWTLTPYGENLLIKLAAKRKTPPKEAVAGSTP
jgi:hypothetical protein